MSLGRLVTIMGGQSEIFPVNFVTQRRTVLFRTAQGTKLYSAVMSDQVAFEADDHAAAEGGASSSGAGRIRAWRRHRETAALVSRQMMKTTCWPLTHGLTWLVGGSRRPATAGCNGVCCNLYGGSIGSARGRSAIASIPQNVTRSTAGPSAAPPARAPRAPSTAKQTKDPTATTGTRSEAGASATTASGANAPAVKVAADASAACSGRAA